MEIGGAWPVSVPFYLSLNTPLVRRTLGIFVMQQLQVVLNKYQRVVAM